MCNASLSHSHTHEYSPEKTEETLLKEVMNFLQDEEIEVRVDAFEAVVDMIDYVTPAKREVHATFTYPIYAPSYKLVLCVLFCRTPLCR